MVRCLSRPTVERKSFHRLISLFGVGARPGFTKSGPIEFDARGTIAPDGYVEMFDAESQLLLKWLKAELWIGRQMACPMRVIRV